MTDGGIRSGGSILDFSVAQIPVAAAFDVYKLSHAAQPVQKGGEKADSYSDTPGAIRHSGSFVQTAPRALFI